jgi:choline dehydrogenase-like flavoprotein
VRRAAGEGDEGVSVRRSGAPADVLVIGAGPSGAVTAKRLAQDGFRVVCLEQGTWPDYAGARASGPNSELAAGRGWDFDPNVRRLRGDFPVDDSESDIAALMFNGVGGGSVLYAAQWTRALPSDFRVRSQDGVADDWPLTYEDLVPYYERVEDDFAVSGLAGDPAYPAGHCTALPPAPIRRAGRRLAAAHDALGWHWWPGSNTIATRAHGHLGACTQRGVCMWGCPEAAKGSADRSVWPTALELGVDLRTHARVSTIQVDRRGRATGAVYVDADGAERFQAASVVVLAANGVGTPRILLNSATPQWPDGLANRSGLVGKRLMMHPFATVVGLFDDPLDTTQGVWGHLIYSLQFYETDPARDFVRGAKWGLVPTGGPLSVTQPYPWGHEPIWGADFHQRMGERLGHSTAWGIIAEDLPNEDNQVLLDPAATDDAGVPGVKVRYRTSENSRRLLAFNVARAEESLRAAGARDVVAAPQLRESGWHLLGTAKMGDDAATSVVDRWGCTHDVPNLYVLDGSTWPTSSGTNPTATIAAMALRSTERLIQAAALQEVAA